MRISRGIRHVHVNLQIYAEEPFLFQERSLENATAVLVEPLQRFE